MTGYPGYLMTATKHETRNSRNKLDNTITFLLVKIMKNIKS